MKQTVPCSSEDGEKKDRNLQNQRYGDNHNKHVVAAIRGHLPLRAHTSSEPMCRNVLGRHVKTPRISHAHTCQRALPLVAQRKRLKIERDQRHH